MSFFKPKMINGVYDELVGEPIGELPGVVHGRLEIDEIARFVSLTMSELVRLPMYEINEVSFDLNICGNKVEFTAKLKPAIQ